MSETTERLPRKRLTELAKCAGCAAKIGPAQLTQALQKLHIPLNENLLVGLTTGDDAGVYRIAPNLALVQTLDFFPPIVDDPYLFGQIAAANSLSDVYAMGGKPLTAMNILCFPIRERGPEELAEILRGGAEKVAEAGASLVGGHSIEDDEPKFGLSVTGLIDPAHIATNAGAKPGDVIVLTKPLGTGIVTTAAKFGECDPEILPLACSSMAALNSAASLAMQAVGIGPYLPIHAATDITGFSLLGHLYHLAKASGIGIELTMEAIPFLPNVREMAAAGNVTRGGKANRAYLTDAVKGRPDLLENWLDLLTDPQTSGGLAICVAPDSAPRLLSELEMRHVAVRAVIGRIVSSPVPSITIQ